MKPTRLPRFKEGVDYRELHPTKEGGKRWRFATARVNSLVMRLSECPANIQAAEFYDATDKLWLTVEVGVSVLILTIEKGYAWNGATPKRWVCPFGWVGTPDFESTRIATLWHDALCQFQDCEHIPFNREQIDLLFKNMISDKIVAEAYYTGVRFGGKHFKRTTHGEYSKPL